VNYGLCHHLCRSCSYCVLTYTVSHDFLCQNRNVAGRKKSENIYFMHIQVSYPLLILLDSDGRGKQIVGKRNMSGAPRSWITPLSTMVEKILGSFSRLLQHKTFTAKENINLFSLGPLFWSRVISSRSI
jgi:hypothetical protein